MATFTKIQNFVEDLGKGVHVFGTHSLKVALAQTVAVTNAVLADITQSTGGGYAAAAVPGSVTWTETTGTATLANGGTDLVFTASGSAITNVRYAVLYNDTPTSPADPLIGYWDYGSNINVADGETFTVNFGASILTVA